MIKIYYKGKILFCMPRPGFRLSDLSLAVDIIADKRGLSPGKIVKWTGRTIHLTG